MRTTLAVLLTLLIGCGDATAPDDSVVIITDNNATPNNTTPNNTAPNNTNPNNTAPNNTAPNNTAPNNTAPNNTAPNNTTPNNTNPNNTKPNNTNPNNTNPNNTNPNNTMGPNVERFSFVEVGFRDPAVAYSPNGTAHYAYSVGATSNQLVYGACTSNCGATTGWQWTSLDTRESISAVRMESDASGRLHMLYEVYESSVTQLFYMTCGGSCTNAGNWSRVDLTPAIGNTWSTYRSSPLAVSATGGVYTITSGNNNGIVLIQCLSNCSNGANWSSGVMRARGDRSTLAVDGTTLHHVVNNETGGLVYRTCSANCTDEANWTESAQIFAHAADGQVRVQVSNGEVRLFYNQGASGNPDPAVVAQDGRLLFWTCRTNCMQPTSWSGTLLGSLRDGFENDMATIGGVTVLTFVSDNLDNVAMACEANCVDPASWITMVIDSTAEMNATVDPYLFLCGSSRPTFAGWYVKAPVVAVSPVTGSALFGSGGRLLQQCSGQYYNTNGMGRVILIP